MAIDKQATSGLSEEVVQAFMDSLRGKLIRPADSEYGSARRVWNGMIDRYPTLIVQVTGTADVVAAVNFAREHDLRLAIRGGGHNVAGNAMCDGGLVIDLMQMRGVRVDPEAKTARVEGGATWGDVDRETQIFGLAAPGGVVSTTGVAGLTLHGGLGWLRRKYGLSIDNVLSVDVVTADGQVRTVSTSKNEDLFWALRGAGSNFGVVTSFEFRLHPIGPTVWVCAPIYRLADAPMVLQKWREFVATAPDEISSNVLIWSMPAHPLFPDHLHGEAILIISGMYAGPVEDGQRLMQPLRALASPILDLSGPWPYLALQSANDSFFAAGDRYYWKSREVDRLDDELIRDLCERTITRPSSRSNIDIWHNGGAINRVGVAETAFGRRDAPFAITFASNWTDPNEDERNVAWAREGWAALEHYSSGGMYLNFPGLGEELEDLVRMAYGPNYERLVALKTKYDPANLFRTNQNIHPATSLANGGHIRVGI